MTFKKLQAEKIKAMKEKDDLRNKTLTLVIANVKNAAIDKKCLDNIPEDLVDEILLKEMKAAKETRDACPENRLELLAEYTSRYLILKSYAPILISDETSIEDFIVKVSEQEKFSLTKNNRGMIMKYIISNYKNKFDMAKVNKVLSKILK